MMRPSLGVKRTWRRAMKTALEFGILRYNHWLRPEMPTPYFHDLYNSWPLVLQAVYYSVGGHYHGHYDSHTRRAQRPCCGRSTMTQCRVCRCVYSTRFRVAHANSYRILTDHITFLTDRVPTTYRPPLLVHYYRPPMRFRGHNVLLPRKCGNHGYLLITERTVGYLDWFAQLPKLVNAMAVLLLDVSGSCCNGSDDGNGGVNWGSGDGGDSMNGSDGVCGGAGPILWGRHGWPSEYSSESISQQCLSRVQAFSNSRSLLLPSYFCIRYCGPRLTPFLSFPQIYYYSVFPQWCGWRRPDRISRSE